MKYTLEEIFRHYKKNLMLHNAEMIIADAAREGYTIREAIDFLRAKGYAEAYLEQALQRLRHLQVIAPWEPD